MKTGPKPKGPEHFWRRVDVSGHPGVCWPWTGALMTNGYGKLRRNKVPWLAHRFAYTDATGPIPANLLVLHRCDNRKCCRPSHLFLGTHADNTADCIAKDRFQRGERHGNAKLDEAAVISMRRMYREGIPRPIIAKIFNISESQTHGVIARKFWKHIQDKAAPHGNFR